MIGFAWHVAGLAATVLFVVGLVVRLSVKDNFVVICAIYYAAPPLVLAVLSAIAGVYWRGRKKRLASGGLFAAAFLCTIWFCQSCYVTNSGRGEASGFAAYSVDECFADGRSIANAAETGENGYNARQGVRDGQRIRLLFWNLCRGRFGWEGIVSTIRRHDPDVIALVESGYPCRSNWIAWRRTFPEYAATIGSEQMVILCRGQIGGAKLHRMSAASRYETADINVRGENFKLVLVDLESAPLLSRAGRIARLAQAAKSLDNEPLVMVGDFNLPIDSVHFDSFDGYLQNAFCEAGSGYAPTWPMPTPVIQIDHVWTNRHVYVESCTAGWSRYSDHRPLVVDFQCK